ncbi:TMV resistance protein N-like [Castanea sativa]|uniref:TMV resistance protein N-like n=1 Tax=Castanea sativa TaxID=21020 RepID=UPI003F6501ED
MTSMSTQKACASLSSSSSASQWKHEVFLSFYWEDTRNTFTDHLHSALIQKGIIVYRDNVNLKEGKPIASELMKAIEESKNAIIILSKNYAFSKRCLNELVKILECKKEKGLKVLPIFYHVMPSDAGNQRETFGKAFLKHEEDRQVSTEQIQKWRTALKEVSKIRGRHLTDSHESEDIQEITKSIFDKLKCESIDDFEDLVGINSRVKEMMKLFNIMSEDVQFIGIWGMSGIGKTTLAYVIYNRICHQFEASSFICDVREIVEKDKQGLVNLQKQLLSETLMEKVNIWNHLQGIKVIKKRLRYKKVLIVLDDVNKDKQLKALAGSPGWFGPGSRIIITSKDKHLLKRHHLGTTIHEVNGLDNDEALELFSWTVFKQPYPKNEFENLSNGFVKYAQGLPIALKVLGSSLIDRPRKLWEDYLHQLKEIPEGEILDKLEISYKGLEDTEQNLFLDIACFFKGEDEDRVAHIEGSGSYKDMETLKDKFLITILRGKLRMHDLIQEMGWRIVRRKSPQEPGLRSRLWLYKDVFHVLKYNTGKDDVEGMVLNSPPHKENLNAEAISNMKNLRLLKISNVHLPTGLNFLSNKLRMMEWHDYPLKFLPMSFQPDNLVELIMPHSHIEQLPVGFSKLDELRLLDLSDSKVLVKTPNFIGCPNLEMLIFQGCTSLYELHPSVGALNKLTLLNLKDCRSLTGLPCEINLKSLKKFILSGCSSLKKFSEIGTNMTRLSELYLDGIAVEELPSSLERLTGMTVLSLQGCKNLSSFPSVNLPSLNTLNLSGFKVQPPKSWLSHGFSLVRAAHAFFQGCFPIREAINLLLPRLRFIVSLNLADRNLWDEALPDDLSGLSSLQDLDLSKNIFTCLPDSFSQLSKLKHLNLNGCSKLQSLPNLPLSVGRVTARRCTSLKNYSNQNFVWTSGGTGFTIVICDDKDDDKMAFYPSPRVPFDDSDPFWERFIEEDGSHKDMSFMEFTSSTEISEWFSPQNPGSSVTIPLPSDLRYNSSWAGMALFVVVEIHENSYNVSSSQDYEVNIDFIYRKDMVEGPIHQIQLNAFNISEVPKFLLDDRSFGFKIRFPAGEREDRLEGCNSIEASFSSHCPYIEIKKCGARILYKKELVEFPQASIIRERGLLKQDQQKVELESSKSDDQSDSKVQLKEKLKSLLLRVYQGGLARNHKYDYVFPHITVPNWFNNQSICSEMRIKLPRNLQSDERWMGIAVCIYYTVHNHNQPAISSDNQDLTSFLDFYTPLDGHRVHLTRHRVFQDSKDIFVESSHRILVFYIPHLFLCLEGCCHVGASFERNNPGVMVKECGIRLVFEQDVEDFMDTLVQCMLGSPDAYHDFFNQNLSHQVEERVAGFDNGKDFGCSSSLQRMPQPMPKLLPSTENIPEVYLYRNKSLLYRFSRTN